LEFNLEFCDQDQEKKKLLCSMLMTASDVASIAKPWEVQHRVWLYYVATNIFKLKYFNVRTANNYYG
jgi:hypothetical protein